MATIPYVPGPSLWYLQSGAQGNWNYLGMCQNETRLGLSPRHRDVYTDSSGEEVPYDLEFHGAEAMVSGELIRYSEPILNLIKAFLDTTGTNDSVAGTLGVGAVGTLVRTENRHFGLAIVSGYGAAGGAPKAVYTAAGMNPGFLFGCAIPIGSFNSGLGAKTKRETIQFRCLPVWNFYGGGQLYVNNFEGVSLPDPS